MRVRATASPAAGDVSESAVTRPERGVTPALGALVVLGVILFLRYAADVFIPVVLGVFVSYALDPVVSALTRVRIPRALGAGFLLVTLLATTVVGVQALSDSVLDIVDSIPPAAQKLRQSLRDRRQHGGGAIEKVEKMASEIERSAAEATQAGSSPGVTRVQVEEKPLDVRGYLWSGSMGLVGLVTQAVLLVFLVYFLLVSGDLFKRKLVAVAGPSLERMKVTVEVLNEINLQVQRYLVVLLLTDAVVAIGSWAAFLALGLPQAAVWALLAGVFHSIPYFGPLIVSVGVALVAFLEFGTIAPAVWAAGLELLITGIVGFLLIPWLVGRTARMNEVAVFLGLLFWAWMWGVAGLLLAVPMLVVVKSVCDRVEYLRPVSELLGD